MVDGLYSLNDIHKASGNNRRHQATNFMRLKNTKDLIDEIERSSYVRNGINSIAYKIIQGGESQYQGTFICYALVYSYAMWISSSFQLLVINSFHSSVIQQQQLSQKLNELCQNLNTINEELSNAGRLLSIGGKQIKPQIKLNIDNTLKQIQPSFELIGGACNGK